ncbi:MAG: cyclase family protein [Acidimicrobiales bacterium]
MPFPDDIAELATRVNNWGRWGDDDQLGTLNLIDDAARLRGVGAATDGRAFSLAVPWSDKGPQMGFIEGRVNPQISTMHTFASWGEPDDFRFHDEALTMGTQACTHWDGLAHATYRGVMYNGTSDAAMDAGAVRCGIEQIDTLVSRGVLLDVARALGVDRLEAGHALTALDLDAAVELADVELMAGDVLLLRTGHMQFFHEGDRMTYATSAAGPSLQSVEWFHAADCAAVATDSLIFEVFPCERPELMLPVHFLHLVEMGLTQGQNFDLEALAADCDADGRYSFLLSASPEPVVGGYGAPVNPVAVK